MFGKTPDQLDADDIANICDEAFAEGQTLEFKSTLPDDGKTVDPWCDGKDKIGELAKAKLLDEIVAFANAYGGWLFIGIDETDDEPKRAKSIAPVRACVDLAVKLQHTCRDTIDPEIPNLQISGVPTEKNGDGIVAIYAAQSNIAPHRNRKTLNCTKRHDDRCEKMSMREVQDLTIAVLNRGSDLEGIFANAKRVAELRYDALTETHQPDETPLKADQPTYTMRTTAVPLEPLEIGRVHGNSKFKPQLWELVGRSKSHGNTIKGFVCRPPERWRPILRGTIGTALTRASHQCDVLLYDTGQLELSHIELEDDGDKFQLHFVWFLGQIWNTLINLERLRNFARTPTVEYELQFELIARHKRLPVTDKSFHGFTDELGAVGPGAHNLVRYSVGPRSEFQDLNELIQQDFLDLIGAHSPSIFEPDFDDIWKKALTTSD